MTEMPKYLKVIEKRRKQGEEEYQMCIATDMIREEGREGTLINDIRNLIKNLQLSLEQAMDVVGSAAGQEGILSGACHTKE